MRICVALRKESVDRNALIISLGVLCLSSLSARRAWIEIYDFQTLLFYAAVALRKESVDRNWKLLTILMLAHIVALRKESVDRNVLWMSRSRL